MPRPPDNKLAKDIAKQFTKLYKRKYTAKKGRCDNPFFDRFIISDNEQQNFNLLVPIASPNSFKLSLHTLQDTFNFESAANLEYQNGIKQMWRLAEAMKKDNIVQVNVM